MRQSRRKDTDDHDTLRLTLVIAAGQEHGAVLPPNTVRWKGRLVQYAGRVLRPYPGKETAEIHDYHDASTSVLAATLTGRAPGYTSLGFPDPRRITPAPTPSVSTADLSDPAAPALTSRLGDIMRA
jgi:hypothetical protein